MFPAPIMAEKVHHPLLGSLCTQTCPTILEKDNNTFLICFIYSNVSLNVIIP